MSRKVDARPVPLPPSPVASKPELKGNTVATEGLLSPKQADAFERAQSAKNVLVGDSAKRTHVATRESVNAAEVAREYVVVSSNEDDPFVRKNHYERMPIEDFHLDENGKPTGLVGPRVLIEEEPILYRVEDNQYVPHANNPWAPTEPNSNGNFSYPREERFPLHQYKVDENGKAVLDKDGLQQWAPRELHTGRTITFEAVNHVSHSMEGWSGRPIQWGDNGQMYVNTHAFVGFNAFFSPAGRALFFGVVPYRLPGETEIKMFEMASSWEVAAHEAGHALHNDLKPNRGLVDTGYRQWGESFGDQLAMWSQLQDPDRVKQILKETRGDLHQQSALTAIGESFAYLVGEGTGIREAFHNKTISTTSDQFHDRSEVLTGAAYKIFHRIHKAQVAAGMPEEESIAKAANVMGTFLARSTDFTPENTMTLEDVAKAYLKVDKEYFGGQYHALLAAEFERREIFTVADPNANTTSSVEEWKAHEANLPQLTLTGQTPEAAEALVKANLEKLDIGPEFGLELQSAQQNASGELVVRVELTRGRGDDAQPLANQGVLVFRADGSLADYQPVMPNGLRDGEALQLLDAAKQAGLDQQGKVGFVPKDGGGWTVQVVVPKEEGAASGAKTPGGYLQVYDLEHPEGRRVEYGHVHGAGCGHEEKLKALLPAGAEILLP